ncbi:DUF4129 domain-containing protein [Streptomyces sp. NPDC012616]|uniref:DUF4129 domain-containing protein n=1 Tax=Streptomyces sp. NPDC012616 TaxID=3364840 RepID=UPI0036E25C5C
MRPTGGVLTAVPHTDGLPLRAPSGLADAVPTALCRAADRAVQALLRAGDGATSALARSGDEPPLTVPRDPAREAARRELSKDLYHQNDPGLFQRTLDTLWDWIGDLFDTASTATPGGTLGLLVVVLGVAAVVAALWWRLGAPRRRPTSAPTLFDDRPRSAAEHRAAAEAHAAQGHWNQALQERMRAVVRALEERALLDARPGRTADEAAAEAGRSLPAHTDRLRAAAGDFDDVTYGGRRATQQSYMRMAALDLDLERAKPELTAHSIHHTAHTARRGAAE